MVAPWMVRMDLFKRVGLKVCFLTCAIYFFSGTPMGIMEWTKLERAFAVEALFSSGRSIVTTQRAFRRHFNIAPRGRVPGQQSIVSWVNNFRETGDVKKKKPSLPRTVRSPQNIEVVR